MKPARPETHLEPLTLQLYAPSFAHKYKNKMGLTNSPADNDTNITTVLWHILLRKIYFFLLLQFFVFEVRTRFLGRWPTRFTIWQKIDGRMIQGGREEGREREEESVETIPNIYTTAPRHTA